MRQTLLFGGLESVSYNLNRKQKNLKMFEFGPCYSYHKEGNSDKSVNNYREDFRLSVFLSGDKTSENWNQNHASTDFFYLKSFVENILLRLGLKVEKMAISIPDSAVYSEGLMYLYNNVEIVSLGLLNKNLLKESDIKQSVYFAEFLWDNVIHAIKKNVILFHELSKFPEVRRDLALVLDKAIPYSRLVELAEKTEKKLLQKVHLFDVYEGDKIPAGKKSYAVSFHLQDETKTLTDHQIDQIMQKLISVFEKELGAEIRK
jgi:phenylalanyl-tRNA synthetase beta chain